MQRSGPAYRIGDVALLVQASHEPIQASCPLWSGLGVSVQPHHVDAETELAMMAVRCV